MKRYLLVTTAVGLAIGAVFFRYADYDFVQEARVEVQRQICLRTRPPADPVLVATLTRKAWTDLQDALTHRRTWAGAEDTEAVSVYIGISVSKMFPDDTDVKVWESIDAELEVHDRLLAIDKDVETMRQASVPENEIHGVYQAKVHAVVEFVVRAVLTPCPSQTSVELAAEAKDKQVKEQRSKELAAEADKRVKNPVRTLLSPNPL